MRKIRSMALLAAAAGVAGGLLRRREVGTVFDAATGLAERGAGVSTALIVLSALTALLCLVLTAAAKKLGGQGVRPAFGGEGPLWWVLAILAAAVAGFSLLEGALLLGEPVLSAPGLVWALGGMAAGLSLLFVAYRGPRGGNVAIAAAVPVLWMCVWLIFSYLDRTSDPVLLGFVYHFFAQGFLVLGLYHMAGYAFFKGKEKPLLFSAAMAVYFTGITMADGGSVPRKAVMLCLALTLLVYVLLMAGGPYGAAAEEAGGEEAPPAEPDRELE